jgi:hypothetical protein
MQGQQDLANCIDGRIHRQQSGKSTIVPTTRRVLQVERPTKQFVERTEQQIQHDQAPYQVVKCAISCVGGDEWATMAASF